MHPLAPYRAPDAREAALERHAVALGAELHAIGVSVLGSPIRALHVPCVTPGAPSVFYGANIHGVELIAVEVCLGFLEALSRDDGFGPSLRARANVWVVPSINPDGYARTWAREGIGELSALRANARGVDLNRNFPKPVQEDLRWLSFAGSDDPRSAFYRGASPLSEPEAAALAGLFARVPFAAAVNGHSFMGTVIPARTTDPEDYATYATLCRALAGAQSRARYRRVAHRRLDVFTGEQEDHQHHAHGTWAVCLESFPIAASFRQHLIAPRLFWRFNPREPQVWVDNDVPAVGAYFLAALDAGPPKSRAG